MSRDSSTTAPLCLACSSSLPPRLWKRTQEGIQSGGDSTCRSDSELFLTRCCGRPICPSCLTSNPRLERYDPCLACFGGAGALGSEKVSGQHHVESNVDGAVRDEDVFVVGDEDEEEDSEMHDGGTAKTLAVKPPEHDTSSGARPRADPDPNINTSDEPPDGNQGGGRYYIQPDDTLLGISLRLGVDGRTLCKLNGLSPSTLRTTPHLLHTRTFLVLPPSHSQQQAMVSVVSPKEETQRKRERAQATFQRVTKETDDGIAQAYVALAEDSDSLKAEGGKESPRVARTLEERAVVRYLDDDEWERRERAEGRGVYIQRLRIGGRQASAALRRAEKAG